ncbi:MAG: hypothetical protein HDQ96_02880 [Lachnospiraceae bacterium]|nr:hypothetical protein [Lachnospiraceae bacterium]
MGYRILYFYKKENAFYREKKRTNVFFSEKGQDDSIKLFFCGLPEYYGRQIRWGGKRTFPVPWNFGQLLRLMQSCCEYVSADAYYLEEQFEKELTEGEFEFTPGRQRMCAELIGKMADRFQGIDSILYLREETEEGPKELPLPERLLRKLRYFFYLGEKSEQYSILEENLWEEYGMPLLHVRKVKELAACRIKRLLVLDDRQEGDADWKVLPKGCVYMDLWSDTGRRTQIAKNRVDIKYISEYLYLRQNLDT